MRAWLDPKFDFDKDAAGAKQAMAWIFFPCYTQRTYGSLQERNSVGLFFAPREFVIKV